MKHSATYNCGRRTYYINSRISSSSSSSNNRIVSPFRRTSITTTNQRCGTTHHHSTVNTGTSSCCSKMVDAISDNRIRTNNNNNNNNNNNMDHYRLRNWNIPLLQQLQQQQRLQLQQQQYHYLCGNYNFIQQQHRTMTSLTDHSSSSSSSSPPPPTTTTTTNSSSTTTTTNPTTTAVTTTPNKNDEKDENINNTNGTVTTTAAATTATTTNVVSSFHRYVQQMQQQQQQHSEGVSLSSLHEQEKKLLLQQQLEKEDEGRIQQNSIMTTTTTIVPTTTTTIVSDEIRRSIQDILINQVLPKIQSIQQHFKSSTITNLLLIKPSTSIPIDSQQQGVIIKSSEVMVERDQLAAMIQELISTTKDLPNQIDLRYETTKGFTSTTTTVAPSSYTEEDIQQVITKLHHTFVLLTSKCITHLRNYNNFNPDRDALQRTMDTTKSTTLLLQQHYNMMKELFVIIHKTHLLQLPYPWTVYQNIINELIVSKTHCSTMMNHLISTTINDSTTATATKLPIYDEDDDINNETVSTTTTLLNSIHQWNMTMIDYQDMLHDVIKYSCQMHNDNGLLPQSLSEKEVQRQDNNNSNKIMVPTSSSSLFKPAILSLIRNGAYTDTIELLHYLRNQYGLYIFDRTTVTEIYEVIHNDVCQSHMIRTRLRNNMSINDDPILIIVSMLEPSILAFRTDWEKELLQRNAVYNYYVDALDNDYFQDSFDDDDDTKNNNSNNNSYENLNKTTSTIAAKNYDQYNNDEYSGKTDDSTAGGSSSRNEEKEDDDDDELYEETDYSESDDDDDDDDDDDEVEENDHEYMLSIHRLLTRNVKNETAKRIFESLIVNSDINTIGDSSNFEISTLPAHNNSNTDSNDMDVPQVIVVRIKKPATKSPVMKDTKTTIIKPKHLTGESNTNNLPNKDTVKVQIKVHVRVPGTSSTTPASTSTNRRNRRRRRFTVSKSSENKDSANKVPLAFDITDNINNRTDFIRGNVTDLTTDSTGTHTTTNINNTIPSDDYTSSNENKIEQMYWRFYEDLHTDYNVDEKFKIFPDITSQLSWLNHIDDGLKGDPNSKFSTSTSLAFTRKYENILWIRAALEEEEEFDYDDDEYDDDNDNDRESPEKFRNSNDNDSFDENDYDSSDWSSDDDDDDNEDDSDYSDDDSDYDDDEEDDNNSNDSNESSKKTT